MVHQLEHVAERPLDVDRMAVQRLDAQQLVGELLELRVVEREGCAVGSRALFGAAVVAQPDGRLLLAALATHHLPGDLVDREEVG